MENYLQTGIPSWVVYRPEKRQQFCIFRPLNSVEALKGRAPVKGPRVQGLLLRMLGSSPASSVHEAPVRVIRLLVYGRFQQVGTPLTGSPITRIILCGCPYWGPDLCKLPSTGLTFIGYRVDSSRTSVFNLDESLLYSEPAVVRLGRISHMGIYVL